MDLNSGFFLFLASDKIITFQNNISMALFIIFKILIILC